MKEIKILIFGGTTEGRKLAEYLVKRQVQVHVCVATSYGESLLPEDTNITVSHNRMDCEEMQQFIRKYRPRYVVDATHPYACLLYTSPSPRDRCRSRMPSSA